MISPKQTNKIIKREIGQTDYHLLLGLVDYDIHHIIKYAMREKTRDVCKLNRYTKTGFDATSRIDEAPISFKDYIKMIKDNI